MRPESLRLLQQAVRVNPHAKVSVIAAEDDIGDALLDVMAEIVGPKDWDVTSWDAALEEIDNDPRTLAEFMDSPAVRALIRAQEAAHAAS